MRTRQIPGTSIQISEVGFGCWTMGGPNWNTSTGQSIGWADVNEDEIRAGIKAGIDGGVNHWDNADIYGNGRAERTLAESFRKLGVDRKTQIIATKVGHFKGTSLHAFDPRHIRAQCEQSLRNLRTDYIDIYYFHHGTYVGPGYDASGNLIPDYDYLYEAAATMHALVQEGKVRAVGQSAYTVDDFARALPVLKPQVVQNKANLRYDDFIRPGSPMQALMQQHNCVFVAFGPLDQGILLDKFDPANPPKFDEGDYRSSRKDFNPQLLSVIHAKLQKVKVKFQTQGTFSSSSTVTTGGSTTGTGATAANGAANADATALLSSVATRWVLSHDRVISAIPGFRNQRQAKCNLQAAIDAPMTQPDATWLRDLFKA
jgi:myo-inositol catabolism protein IolS